MEGRKRKRKWIIVLSGLVLAGLIATAVAVAVNRSGKVTNFAGRDEIVEACTSTTSFQTIPGMARTFTQGTGGGAGVIQFSGALSLSSNSLLDTGFLRLTIDGVQQGPGVVPAIGANERGAHAFNWQAPLAAGSHTARIQWRTDLGGTLCADARSMIIFFHN
jgi:hypothetical protein